MGYVKGCDLIILTKYIYKKIEKNKIVLGDGIKTSLSLERLGQLIEEANETFTEADGKNYGSTAGRVYGLLKKVDGKKQLLGIAVIKRVQGEPSDKSGVAAWFADSTDSYITAERFFADGFTEEEKYFDESVIGSLKGAVGLGQVRDAYYRDKVIARAESKTFMGMKISRAVFFILMLISWGIIFHDVFIGLGFAFIFISSFVTITSKVDVRAEELSDVKEGI